MAENSLKFHLADVNSIDELAEKVTAWEQMALARSQNAALSQEMRRYNLGIADAMAAVRLQFTKLHVGIRPASRPLEL